MKNLTSIYSENYAISLLIRHSDRYRHSDMQNPRLTEQGISNAIELGRKLSNYQINKIITTDVDRCIQTAENIIKGYDRLIETEISKYFGRLHYADRNIGKEFLRKHGYDEFYKNIISGIDTPGIHNTDRYNKLMTDFIIDKTIDHGITIFISHDINIAYYHFSIDRTIYEKYTDVKYLCGIILCNGEHASDFQN